MAESVIGFKQDIEKVERSLRTLENNIYGYGGPGYNMNKYKSGACHNGKAFHLGYFDTEEEARDAYNDFVNSINK